MKRATQDSATATNLLDVFRRTIFMETSTDTSPVVPVQNIGCSQPSQLWQLSTSPLTAREGKVCSKHSKEDNLSECGGRRILFAQFDSKTL
jgi:hypothetical protein